MRRFAAGIAVLAVAGIWAGCGGDSPTSPGGVDTTHTSQVDSLPAPTDTIPTEANHIKIVNRFAKVYAFGDTIHLRWKTVDEDVMNLEMNLGSKMPPFKNWYQLNEDEKFTARLGHYDIVIPKDGKMIQEGDTTQDRIDLTGGVDSVKIRISDYQIGDQQNSVSPVFSIKPSR